jgi:AcrR family transcriptional regulator
MAATRLPSRKERQAETRALLMRSAARVAARRGLEAASVDEVAREAGFTKGAVYANFESKEDLFLSMLDERFAERLRDIDRVLREGGTPEEQARRAASDFIATIGAAPGWERLFFEFAVYATRHEDFRRRLVRRYRDLRERIAELLARRAEELGIEPALPPEQVAAMTFAMTNGMALERLLEPEAVPDDLYPAMMATFFAGLQRR